MCLNVCRSRCKWVVFWRFYEITVNGLLRSCPNNNRCQPQTSNERRKLCHVDSTLMTDMKVRFAHNWLIKDIWRNYVYMFENNIKCCFNIQIVIYKPIILNIINKTMYKFALPPLKVHKNTTQKFCLIRFKSQLL